MFNINDLPLICLLLITIAMYFIGYRSSYATILLAGVTLGKGARFALEAEDRGQKTKVGRQKSEVRNFLLGLVVTLAFSSWWHLDMSDNFYSGPRWMGLWNNPNIYGMLMGAGVVLATGLFLADRRWQVEDGKGGKQNPESRSQKMLKILFAIAIFMMSVGLVMSYSRGAWVGTAVGLLYVAWCYGKLKWKYVVVGAGLLALGVGLFWGRTADNAPWYLKRMDFSRPSAQHRVSAWRGAVQMMRDHPFGVGWNKAVSVYDKEYSPPEGGAAALTMNSYLMLGTELGLPGLACFVAYVGLCYRKSPRLGIAPSSLPSPPMWEKGSGKSENANVPLSVLPTPSPPLGEKDGLRGSAPEQSSTIRHHDSLRAVCLAGALVFVVAFWFDGGLFTLATASVFWVLLELGSEAEGGRQRAEVGSRKSEVGSQSSEGGSQGVRNYSETNISAATE